MFQFNSTGPATHPALAVEWIPPSVAEPIEPENWEQVVILEPALLRIEADAKRDRKAARRSSLRWHLYEDYKRRLGRFVGWDARMPILSSSNLYDLVHRRIMSALGVA